MSGVRSSRKESHNRKMIKGSNLGKSNDIIITFAKTRYRGKILERDERII